MLTKSLQGSGLISRQELSTYDDDSWRIQSVSSAPGSLAVHGRVYHFIPLEGGSQLIDIYMQNGPEFVKVSSGVLGGKVPKVGMGWRLSWRA